MGSVRYGALLYDKDYFPFIQDLISSATKKILIMMFFMRYEDEAKYPTDSLIQSLIQANSNGIEVKVILDLDAEGDVFGSRFINHEVFETLSKHGVPVRYDRPDQLTHAKLIIVDDVHVVVGSHNWTAGSFFAYDDTSIYVKSTDMASKLDWGY